MDEIAVTLKASWKHGLEFIAAGIAYTILDAEQRTFRRFAQACIVASFVGYMSMPLILEALRRWDVVPMESKLEVAGSLAALSAFMAHYFLRGLMLIGRKFAENPIRFWKGIKK